MHVARHSRREDVGAQWRPVSLVNETLMHSLDPMHLSCVLYQELHIVVCCNKLTFSYKSFLQRESSSRRVQSFHKSAKQCSEGTRFEREELGASLKNICKSLSSF